MLTTEIFKFSLGLVQSQVTRRDQSQSEISYFFSVSRTFQFVLGS